MLSETPQPTLSEAGCMEKVSKVWRELVRLCQLDTTVKWHPICSTNVKELHGTCLRGKKNPTSKSLPQVWILLWNKGLFVLVPSAAKVLWKSLEYFFSGILYQRVKKEKHTHTLSTLNALSQESERVLL